MRRSLILLTCLLGAALVALKLAPMALSKLQETKQPTIPILIVSKTSFERIIPAEGYLKAVKATPINAPVGRSRLKIAWLKENGSVVKKGEVVVRFDRSKFERDLEDGLSDTKVANAKLSSERVSSSDAQSSRKRIAELARMDLAVTETRALEVSEDIYSKNELLTSRIDGLLSKARVEHSGATNKIDRSISQKKIELLALQKRAAELKVSKANSGLERMEVTAPHDGIFVLERAKLKAGDTIYPGRPVGKLPLIETMEAEVFVLEADAMGLVPDIPALLQVESHGETSFKASIKKVDALARRRQEDVPTQYFSVTLAIEKTDVNMMKPGQRVQAQLNLSSVEAIVVPRQCIFDVDGSLVAYKKRAGIFEAVQVKLGAGSPGLVVVESGLEVGDQIATQAPDGASSGDDEKSLAPASAVGSTP